MMSTDAVGEPIIISKCKIGKSYGLLVVSDNGFAWRIQYSFMRDGLKDIGKSKWVRWYDVERIIPDKPKKGRIKIEIVKRKKGKLIKDGRGNPKITRWRLTASQNRGELYSHFVNRRKDFYRIIQEIFEKNKTDKIPITSDSRIA